MFNGKNGAADVSDSAVADNRFGVDNTKPVSTVDAATPGGNLSTSGTASDATSGLSSLLIEVHQNTCAGAVVASDSVGVSGGTWSKNFSAAAVTAPGSYCVTSTATDNAGNVQTTLGSKTYTVATPPTVPTIISTIPANGSTGIEPTADVSVTFSEVVSVTTSPSWLTFSCATSGTHAGATIGSGTSTVTFDPTVDFAFGESCTATVQAARVTTNLSGNVSFTFTIKAAVTNTPPVVNVVGPTNGSSYAKGSVPAASCSVVDTQDGSPTVDPVIGAITGPDATFGIGSQTVTCAYTDNGGLSDSDDVGIHDQRRVGAIDQLRPHAGEPQRCEWLVQEQRHAGLDRRRGRLSPR